MLSIHNMASLFLTIAAVISTVSANITDIAVRRSSSAVLVTPVGRVTDRSKDGQASTSHVPAADAIRRHNQNRYEVLKHKSAGLQQCSASLLRERAKASGSLASLAPWPASLLASKSVSPTKPSVLLLGSSVDRKALVEYCNHTRGDMRFDDKLTQYLFLQNEPRICNTAEVDFGYLFQPGSGPPPYWGCEKAPGLTCGNHTSDGHVQHATTDEIVRLDAPDFATRNFRSAPSLIVVESSLWDLARWWRQDGMLQHPSWKQFNKNLEGHVAGWCNDEVPKLLAQVQRAFPSSCVAFRTPPTVNLMSIGQTPEALERMTQCIRRRLNGSYLVIDFHQIVDDMVQKGRTLDTLLPDGRHPGADASIAYLDLVTGLALGRVNAEEVQNHLLMR